MNEGIKHGNDGSLGFNEYQAKAWTTNCYPVEQMTACLVAGLCSEAGEVAGKWKKAMRDGTSRPAGMAAELGDCLWYLACLAGSFGYTLEEIAALNLAKLASRQKRGVIGGSGDER